MNIIDISWPLECGMTTYKNREDIQITPTKTWEQHAVRESCITISSHVGTHVDAPAHFLAHGGFIESVSLSRLCGPCVVLDMTHVEGAITKEHLEQQSITIPRVLLKTRNSFLDSCAQFKTEFVYLAESGAQYLQEKGALCIGIDYLGIERQQPQHQTHTILLKADIALIEGLRLHTIQAGFYILICLPLACKGLEAAPARAVLVSDF